MKLLIIICSHELDIQWCDNIKILNDYITNTKMEVDYCGISNQDDFHNYESIIQFRYKIINTKLQFSKICDFISDYKSELCYDWYIKIRPEIKLLENINFSMMSENSINSRARIYNGPKKIKYGMSVNGEGIWKHTGNCYYADNEHSVTLDDQIFIFHKNILEMGAFDRIQPGDSLENETFQTDIWNTRNIPLNVIGIYVEFKKYNVFSGDIH